MAVLIKNSQRARKINVKSIRGVTEALLISLGYQNKDLSILFVDNRKIARLNRDYFNKDIGGKLFPLDVLSASVLTLSLQKYGQNERSLFSFLDSNDPYNLFDYDQIENPYFNVTCVYEVELHITVKCQLLCCGNMQISP